MRNYEKGSLIVTPRKVEAWDGARDEPDDPKKNVRALGGHWVGWIRFEYDDGPTDYAVWQDYKRRGYFFWTEGMSEALPYRGTRLELIQTLERAPSEGL